MSKISDPARDSAAATRVPQPALPAGSVDPVALKPDMSGYVHSPDGWRIDGSTFRNCASEDLNPFQQGYVEAALRDAPAVGPLVAIRFPGFSDLAPATLAAMLKDCERFLSLRLGWDDADHGRHFWAMRVHRQIGGVWHPDLPPLTLYLGDDGKIYQREVR